MCHFIYLAFLNLDRAHIVFQIYSLTLSTYILNMVALQYGCLCCHENDEMTADADNVGIIPVVF